MKKNYLKMLLAAVCMAVGSSAWAGAGDVITNADIDFSNAIANGAVAGTVNSMTIGSGEIAKNGDAGWLSLYDATSTVTIPAAQYAGSKDIVNIQFKTAWGNKNNMGFGFNIKDSEEAVIASFKHARWDGNSSNSNSLNVDMNGLMGAHNSNKPMTARYTLFDISINYATKIITTKVYCNNTDGKGATAEQTFTASFTNANPVAKFEIYGYGVGGNTDRASIFDDLVIKTTIGDYTVESANYTINWVCGETIVKTTNRIADAGSNVSLLDIDHDSFSVDGTKYMYVSDDASGKTVAANGSTVVTITVKEPAVYNYAVNAIDASNNILAELGKGSVYEDENSVTTRLPWNILYNGTLYNQNSNSNTTAIINNNQVVNIAYAATANTNIVFYTEGGDISGGTKIDHAGCSNGAAARALNAAKFATLEAGKYKVVARFVVGNGKTGETYATNPITVGTTALEYKVPAKTNTVYTSEEFSVAGSTDLYVTFAGSSISGVDYIYIQQTSASKSISAAGYATYCSPCALDFSAVEGLTAYIVTGSAKGSQLSLTPVTSVPANTGVLLEGAAGTYEIPVVASSSTNVSANKLVGVTEETSVGGEIYVLMNEDKGVGFYKATNPTAAFTVGANTAYLPANFAAANIRFIGFENGEATAIKTVEAAEKAETDAAYNLAGQRVNAGYKGIVIKGGKKIYVK